MSHFVEIRSYNLKPGTRDRLQQIMAEQALPMLARWGVDVVACGPSLHDQDSYYLMRAYPSLRARKARTHSMAVTNGAAARVSPSWR